MFSSHIYSFFCSGEKAAWYLPPPLGLLKPPSLIQDLRFHMEREQRRGIASVVFPASWKARTDHQVLQNMSKRIGL